MNITKDSDSCLQFEDNFSPTDNGDDIYGLTDSVALHLLPVDTNNEDLESDNSQEMRRGYQRCETNTGVTDNPTENDKVRAVLMCYKITQLNVFI